MLASSLADGRDYLGLNNKGQKMKLRHLLFAAAAVLATVTQGRADGFSDTNIGLRDG